MRSFRRASVPLLLVAAMLLGACADIAMSPGGDAPSPHPGAAAPGGDTASAPDSGDDTPEPAAETPSTVDAPKPGTDPAAPAPAAADREGAASDDVTPPQPMSDNDPAPDAPGPQAFDDGAVPKQDGLVDEMPRNADGVYQLDDGVPVARDATSQAAAEALPIVWERFQRLLPVEYRDTLDYLTVFASDSPARASGVAGYYTTSGDTSALGIRGGLVGNPGPAGEPCGDHQSLGWVLCHEAAHLITLTEDPQLGRDFIDEFYRNGSNYELPDDMTDPLEELGGDHTHVIGEGGETNDLALEGSGLSITGECISRYACTQAAEDLAESLTAYFALDPLPTGDSPAARKVRYFENVPDMVQLRAHMWHNA